MAGLLDFYDDPQANMALAAGLLSGGNFGSALGKGLAGAQAVMTAEEERKRRNEYMKAQEEELRSHAAERQMKIEAARRLEKMTSGLFGQVGNQGGGYSGGDAFMPGAPSNPAGSPQTPQPNASWLSRASLDDVTALKVAGGPDLTEQWKLMHIGSSIPAGAYRQTADGKREFMVDPKEPFTMNNGVVGLAPGASNVPLFRGAVKAAETAGVNENTLAPLDRINPADNRPYSATTGQLVRNVSGQPSVQSSGYAGGSRDAANADSLRLIRGELAQAQAKGDAPLAQALQREIQKLESQTPGQQVASNGFNGFAGPADITKATEQAKADVARGEVTKTKLTKADEMLFGISRAKELLGQGPTESLIGSGVDKAYSWVGKSTKSADVAAQLEALSGWMVSNVPRMEGPQSNFDVDNYKTMAGKVGDRTLPISTRLAAANEVEKLERKYADLNKDQVNGSGGASGSWGSDGQQSRKPVAQGLYNGRNVIKYSDGSTEYAN